MKKFIPLLIVILVWACQEETLNTYDAKNHIYFSNKSTTDSVFFSFFFFPGESDLKIPVSVTYSGNIMTEEHSYRLIVDEEASTVDPANYDIPTNLSFQAGECVDTVLVVIKKTAALDNQEMRLVLKIAEDKYFQVGPPPYLQSIIRFTAKAVKPGWWDDEMDKNYLGKYSDTKYSKFIEVTGINSLEGMSAGEIRYYVLKFKYYLQEMKDENTPVMDGVDEMTVTILG